MRELFCFSSLQVGQSRKDKTNYLKLNKNQYELSHLSICSRLRGLCYN